MCRLPWSTYIPRPHAGDAQASALPPRFNPTSSSTPPPTGPRSPHKKFPSGFAPILTGGAGSLCTGGGGEGLMGTIGSYVGSLRRSYGST